MDLKPILKKSILNWLYFIPNFSSSILYLLTTFLHTLYRLILFLLTLSTVLHYHPPPFTAAIHHYPQSTIAGRQRLPLPSVTTARLIHHRLLPSAVTICHHPSPPVTTICCRQPPPIVATICHRGPPSFVVEKKEIQKKKKKNTLKLIFKLSNQTMLNKKLVHFYTG